MDSIIKLITLNGTTYEVVDEASRNDIGNLANLPTADKSNLVNSIISLKDEFAAMVGTPLTANTAADMVDTTKIYVYTGSESGYTAGHWYYYDGAQWVDGGVYNSGTADNQMSTSSTNPVQNKVVTAYINDFKDDVDIHRNLLSDGIFGTTQTYSIGKDGSVTQILYKSNNTTIRTDTFVYSTNSITETRTLSTGDVLVITYNLDTLEITMTYTPASN